MSTHNQCDAQCEPGECGICNPDAETDNREPPCAYCKHPKHKGVQPAQITTERAMELWEQRTSQYDMPLTAAECEAVRVLWERMPGHACYFDAFLAIRANGFHAALCACPLQRGDRVRWEGRPATVNYARLDRDVVRAYSILLDDQRDRAGYEGTIVRPDSLTHIMRHMTHGETDE